MVYSYQGRQRTAGQPKIMRTESPSRHAWDCLIVTAANAPQAAAYAAQIRFRREAGEQRGDALIGFEARRANSTMNSITESISRLCRGSLQESPGIAN